MTTLRIRLFGTLHLQRDRQVLDELDTRIGELFSYLLLHRDRPQSRELLAGTLWGDNSTGQSRKYLRQALWQLQSALDLSDEPDTQRLFLVDPNWIRVNPNADYWLDVDAFERTYWSVQGMDGADLDADAARSLEQTVELYRGDLLEGCYQDWCTQERERLQVMYLSMLDKLVRYCEAERNYERGLIYGEQILRFDRAYESAYFALMRLHYLAGDRTMALRQYERCVRALEADLDVRPSLRTEILYQQIRDDRLDRSDQVILNNGARTQELALSLSDVMAHLNQIQVTLTDLKNQLRREAQAMD